MTEFVYGVDVNASSAAFGCLSLPGGDEAALTWKIDVAPLKLHGGNRLVALRAKLEDAFDGFGMHGGPTFRPTFVLLEYPMVVRGGSEAMMKAIGVTEEFLCSRFNVPTLTLVVPTWKKEAGIGGNATKDRVRERALELGLHPDASEDEADALVIADVARNRWRNR